MRLVKDDASFLGRRECKSCDRQREMSGFSERRVRRWCEGVELSAVLRECFDSKDGEEKMAENIR
jgi:hypothetical protein